MDKILAFIKEAKWFSISIGIFMVIWLGPKLLDKIEEIQAEAERQTRIEQQEIARQEQIKKDAIEREERLARLEIEKEERRKQAIIKEKETQKRLAAERLAGEKRLAAERIEKEKEDAQKALKDKKLRELEIGLYCQSSKKNHFGDIISDTSMKTEIILIRDLSEKFIDALSVDEKKYTGTKETLKSWKRASDKDRGFTVSPVNFSIEVAAKLSTVSDFQMDYEPISIDRTTLEFTYPYTSEQIFEGTCYRRNAELFRQQVEGHNLKNKSNNQL